jgi:hypothetical protein
VFNANVATIEAQGKFVQETMKNYLSLLEVVDDLRNKEEAKKQARVRSPSCYNGNKTTVF